MAGQLVRIVGLLTHLGKQNKLECVRDCVDL